MKRSPRALILLLVLMLGASACDNQAGPQLDANRPAKNEDGVVSKSAEPAAKETPEKKVEAAKTPADKLAERVIAASGDPESLSRLEFSFVPRRDGEEVSRRHHNWQPKAGEVTITAGEKDYRLTHLRDYDLTKLSAEPDQHAEAWEAIAPDLTPEEAAKAWGWFINDSYWLLVPSKLMDEGVNRELDDQGRLVLTFGEVGLTPGDRYALTVDPETHRVTRWEFKLQGGNEGDFAWSDYQEVGPLTLSGMRRAKDSEMAITFDNLRAQP